MSSSEFTQVHGTEFREYSRKPPGLTGRAFRLRTRRIPTFIRLRVVTSGIDASLK